MSTSRHFNFIAVLAMIAALIITALFMNGEAFGLQRYLSDEETGLFSEVDLNDDWSTEGATKITLTGDGAEIEGTGAYVQNGDVIIYAGGYYVLEGTLDNGSVIVNETSKTKGRVWILLNGVSIYCEDSAALDVEEATKVILTLAEGTENVLESGSEYSEDAVNANIRGALFSRDDLTVNGSGSLEVTAAYRHGIVCNDDLRVTGGNITVTAAEDSIHANESARFTGMTLTISAGDDGITVSDDENHGELLVDSGTIRILSAREGMESEKVTINGGEIEVNFTDDGINAGGTEPELVINGGVITLISEDGRDVDGLDSNNSIEINGGTILISVNAENMNNAIDFGSETGGSCSINGGTVIAAGSGGMAEEMSSDSAQTSLMYRFENTYTAGETIRLADLSGNVILEAEIPCSFNSLILSDPTLLAEGSYQLSVGEDSFEITMDSVATSLGTAAGGMGGGFGHGGFGRGGFGRETADSQDASESLQEMTQEGRREELINREELTDADGNPIMQRTFGSNEMMTDEMPEGGPMMGGDGETAPEGFRQGGRPGEFAGGPGGMMNGPGEVQEETGMSAADMKTALMISGASLAVLLFGILIMAKAKNRKNIA